jgi:hypothetical protein
MSAFKLTFTAVIGIWSMGRNLCVGWMGNLHQLSPLFPSGTYGAGDLRYIALKQNAGPGSGVPRDKKPETASHKTLGSL